MMEESKDSYKQAVLDLLELHESYDKNESDCRKVDLAIMKGFSIASKYRKHLTAEEFNSVFDADYNMFMNSLIRRRTILEQEIISKQTDLRIKEDNNDGWY